MELKGRIKERLQQLETHKAVLLLYLNEKIKEEDFHAVSDAANDLRDIDAEVSALKMVLEWTT
jgi:hypothetical protein